MITYELQDEIRPLHVLCVIMYVFGVLHDVCYMLCGFYTW